jgi:hypothetical protein
MCQQAGGRAGARQGDTRGQTLVGCGSGEFSRNRACITKELPQPAEIANDIQTATDLNARRKLSRDGNEHVERATALGTNECSV